MTQIKENVYWAGYIDWDLRNFHGYSTPYGSTYNAYLILDEKPTLIDTVKHYGAQEMISRIKNIIDPAKIVYIISNHTEMDHSGSIDTLLTLCPNAVVVASPQGEKHLKLHFKKDWKIKVVDTGSELNIGKRTLKFFTMPMVHWPDSMATYSPQDKILFPNDAFGQHYACKERFCDEVGPDIIFREAAKYYANIVMPYGAQVQKVLGALSGAEFDTICPSHGLIWRRKEDIEKIITLYKQWSSYTPNNQAVIIYDTMWHSTEAMAKTLYRHLNESVPTTLINLQNSHISDAVTEVMLSKLVFFGTPIMNSHMLPSMGGLLTYLKGLKPKNRYAFTFGSYGWSNAGFKEVEEDIEEAGMELKAFGAYFQFVPGENALNSLKELAQSALKFL